MLKRVGQKDRACGGGLGLDVESFGDESKEQGEQFYARLCLILKFCSRVYGVLGAALGNELVSEDFCNDPFVAIKRNWDRDLDRR